MVSSMSLIGIAFSMLVSILLPIGLIIYARKRYSVRFSSLVVGALIFIISVLVLESLVHAYVLNLNPVTKSVMENPWIFATYGALAAGIFEETGRLAAFKLFLKKQREWKDGFAYGIGHGGIEAIILAGLAGINNLIYSLFINKGTFDTLVGAKLPAGTGEQLKNTLINTNWPMFFISGIERCFALTIQIGLSILVIYAVRNRKYIYYLLAILIHALIDFPAALVQKGILSIWAVEGMIFVVFIIGIYWILKSKKLFNSDNISISL